MRIPLFVLRLTTFGALFCPQWTRADPNDWVNPRYVLATKAGDPTTASAQQGIISNAAKTAKGGPWMVTTSKDAPPSNNLHDYLSWAPYHWPNCNWCPKGSKMFVESSEQDQSNAEVSPVDHGSDLIDHLDPDLAGAGALQNAMEFHPGMEHDLLKRTSVTDELDWSLGLGNWTDDFVGQNDGLDAALPPVSIADGIPVLAPPPSSATASTQTTDSEPSSSSVEESNSTSETTTPTGAYLHPMTNKKQNPCTPSPTKTLSPSATWTSCDYVPRDGQVNPDVRTLNGASDINAVSQSVLYNAIAYALTRQSTYSSNAALFLERFFFDKATFMNPNVNYGQVVRGPGTQTGSYMGIVDLRGMVKVSNAVMILRGIKSPDWTAAKDSAMVSWAKSYIKWLQTSDLGVHAQGAKNNHGTFYYSQLAAIQLLSGDQKGAATSLHTYFTGPYMEQIVASGEQPLEAVRTRPFHYRCFNIEAMLTNAKLGDQLGMNYWTFKTKYGATIQTAINYVMSLNPGKEDGSEAYPHVAAAAAAYGDPQKKYINYLRSKSSSYTSQSFWYYDQPHAFDATPSTSPLHNRGDLDVAGEDPLPSSGASAVQNAENCPPVFGDSDSIELDVGISVTCDILEPYYPKTM
ncbi:chondroitin AC/alginate lyase [Sistotremastrum niveocremeum HHB9708]|uniref:Chondroitin AC/alginate lyase n=1 Tax=Sistotremastrum niveocremeum HHB9708 TaxID=1314777 RepID=A0A164U4V9_9AGAM|nr:chondroitin AC/alginate lyase [Sistotremastrum niveocremeum HHB9708]